MVSGIILASGFSRRMQQNKLLLEVEGVPMVERVVRSAVASKLDECFMVFRESEVEAIGEKYGLKTVINRFADRGQSESVMVGVEHALKTATGYLFMGGDQPFLSHQD